MMFSSASGPDPQIAWQVIMTLGVLAAIGASVFTMISSRRTQKRDIQQPLIVRPDERCASKDEFERHTNENRQDFAAVRDEMKKDRQDNQIHASTRASAIYKQIEGTQDKLRTEIRSVSEKFEDLPEKLINMLEKLGKLK